MQKLLIFLAILAQILAIPINNGIQEVDPYVYCDSNDITIYFYPRNQFQGFVYVKGHAKQQGCRSVHTGGDEVNISLPFDTCNVQSFRSLNPPGIYVTTTVIITFHPKFETMVDRIFNIKCFYSDSSETVTGELKVSGLSTSFQTETVELPVCRYEILDGGPNGAPVRFATVGQKIYHKWTCDSEAVDVFCLRVHSCFVDDGNGDRVNILNEEGCAQDRYLLQNLEYLTDLMAGQETHVFKFADRSELFFRCQISITIKEPNSQCPNPQCEEPTKDRKRRISIEDFRLQFSGGSVDVVAKFETFDLDEDFSFLLDPRTLKTFRALQIEFQNENFCFSTVVFSFFVSAILLIFVIFVTIFVVFFMRRSKN